MKISSIAALLGLAGLAAGQDCKVLDFSSYYNRGRGEWISPKNGKNAEIYWGFGMRVDGQTTENLVVMDTYQPEGNGIIVQDPYTYATPVAYDGPGNMVFKFETPIMLQGMDFVKASKPIKVSFKTSGGAWSSFHTVDKFGSGPVHHDFMANDVVKIKVKMADAGAVTKIKFCNFCAAEGGASCVVSDPLTDSPTSTPVSNPPDPADPADPVDGYDIIANPLLFSELKIQSATNHRRLFGCATRGCGSSGAIGSEYDILLTPTAHTAMKNKDSKGHKRLVQCVTVGC